MLAAARHPAAEADRAAGVARPQRPALVGAHARGTAGAHDGNHVRTASTRPVRGTASCRRSPGRSSARRARSVTDARGQLVRSDDHGDRRARAVGRLHLALHAPLVERPVGGDARPRAARRPGPAPPARRSCRRRRPATRAVGAGNTPSASQASRIRSMPAPKPMPRCRAGRPAPRRGRRSDRRRRWRSAPSRARATGTRTACGCSSRGRARGGARSRTAMPSAFSPACTRSKCASASGVR